MEEPFQRLKAARENAGFSTAADAVRRFGWVFSTYAGHENGSAGIRPKAAERYGAAFKVSPAWLLYGTGSREVAIGSTPMGFDESAPAIPDPSETLVPVYDIAASAGYGSLVTDDAEIVDTLSFPRHYLQRIANRSSARDLAIISVKGDSMLPTLASGDVVLVDLSKRDASYDGLFVLRNGGDALLVKRLAPGTRKGTVTLISDNSRLYPPIERPAEEVEIVGKVLWMGVKV